MKRRLYFRLPDAGHTWDVVNELEASGIDRRPKHVVAAPDVDLEVLPAASARTRARTWRTCSGTAS